MNQENQLGKGQRRPVSEKYIDSGGKEQIRGSSTDIETLPFRHIEAVWNLPGFGQDEELTRWMAYARAFYDAGDYIRVYQYLTLALERMPALEPYIFYYMRVCQHVLSVPLESDEVEYEAKLTRYRALPRWLRWLMPTFEVRLRCKWCGRYTMYTNPNVPFGFLGGVRNSCMSCGRIYPMPSWIWDSPDGRAYSYYRLSFTGDEFYDEFERDYDPKPLCQHRRK